VCSWSNTTIYLITNWQKLSLVYISLWKLLLKFFSCSANLPQNLMSWAVKMLCHRSTKLSWGHYVLGWFLPRLRLDLAGALTWAKLELLLWNFNIMLPIKIALMVLLFVAFRCTVCPIDYLVASLYASIGCQSGAVVRSMFEIKIGDSLWQHRFPPGAPVPSYIHYKSPNIVYRANNVLVDAQLSIQYFFNMWRFARWNKCLEQFGLDLGTLLDW
jgi:hypothetical protein